MRSLLLVMMAIALVPGAAGAAQPTGENSTAKRISSHIQQSGQLRNYRIGVTYQSGVATLAGSVTSPQQRNAAIRLAKEIGGVKHVECKLDLVPADSTSAGSQLSIANAGAELDAIPTGVPSRKQAASQAEFQSERSGIVQAAGNQQQMRPIPRQRINRGQAQTRGQAQALPQPPRAMNMQRSAAPMPGRRPQPMRRGGNMPLPAARTAPDPAVRQASADCYQAGGPQGAGQMGGPGMMAGPGMGAMPSGVLPTSYGHGPAYENPSMPGYAWPSYASYPNYAALSYPQQYSPTAWPYIGPFYPYPQVPLAWRKVSLEWDDGWWFLDFSAHNSSH